MSESSHLSPKALAKRWSLTTATLARWRFEGMGPDFMKIRGRIRYRQADIEHYERHSLQQHTETRR